MILVNKFLKKTRADRILYLEAAFWLGISRLAISVVPFKRIAPFLGVHMASSDVNGNRQQTASRVSCAIRVMSFHLPWECKCLAQAISGKMMLQKRKISSTLYLGMAKDENGVLSAHAWLRSGDAIITGGGNLQRFTVISTFA
jgi:hypothetical protein